MDFDEDSYLAVYESENTYADGKGPYCLLYKLNEECEYADYFSDLED